MNTTYKWQVINITGPAFWMLEDPPETFIVINVKIYNDGVKYEVSGPAGIKEYPTLQEAKLAGEFMCEWMENNPQSIVEISEHVTWMLPWNCPLP